MNNVNTDPNYYSSGSIDNRWDTSYKNRVEFASTRSNNGMEFDYDKEINSKRISDTCKKLSTLVKKIF